MVNKNILSINFLLFSLLLLLIEQFYLLVNSEEILYKAGRHPISSTFFLLYNIVWLFDEKLFFYICVLDLHFATINGRGLGEPSC